MYTKGLKYWLIGYSLKLDAKWFCDMAHFYDSQKASVTFLMETTGACDYENHWKHRKTVYF